MKVNLQISGFLSRFQNFKRLTADRWNLQYKTFISTSIIIIDPSLKDEISTTGFIEYRIIVHRLTINGPSLNDGSIFATGCIECRITDYGLTIDQHGNYIGLAQELTSPLILLEVIIDDLLLAYIFQ